MLKQTFAKRRATLLWLILSLLVAPVTGHSQDDHHDAALEMAALEADLLRLSLHLLDLREGTEDAIKPFALTHARLVDRLDYFNQSLQPPHPARESLDRFQRECRSLLASGEVIASRTQLLRDLRREADLFRA